MSPHRPITRASVVALALFALDLVGGCAHRVGRATIPTAVTVESDEWTLWARGEGGSLEACASPCVIAAEPGEVAVRASERGASSPQHEVWVPIDEPCTLTVGRWSHAGERIAGGILLGLGLLGLVVPPIAIAEASDDCSGSFCVGPGAAAGLVSIFAAPPSLVVMGVGAGLLAWNDTLSITESERGPTVRLVPTFAPIEGGAALGLAGSF